MKHIRLADPGDLARIAEIEIFNYRLNFYPIFRSDEYYFGSLQVPRLMEERAAALGALWVYDDGVVKGFLQVEADEVVKLFVEPVLQGQSIGSALLEYAVSRLNARWLWALEKNDCALRFYARHGFRPTGDRQPEEDTEEYLIRLERQ